MQKTTQTIKENTKKEKKKNGQTRPGESKNKQMNKWKDDKPHQRLDI